MLSRSVTVLLTALTVQMSWIVLIKFSMIQQMKILVMEAMMMKIIVLGTGRLRTKEIINIQKQDGPSSENKLGMRYVVEMT